MRAINISSLGTPRVYPALCRLSWHALWEGGVLEALCTLRRLRSAANIANNRDIVVLVLAVGGCTRTQDRVSWGKSLHAEKCKSERIEKILPTADRPDAQTLFDRVDVSSSAVVHRPAATASASTQCCCLLPAACCLLAGFWSLPAACCLPPAACLVLSLLMATVSLSWVRRTAAAA